MRREYVSVVMEPELLAEIERVKKQDKRASRSDAIRFLVWLGLEKWKGEQDGAM